MSNQYTPQQIAHFIAQYAEDSNVKKELKKYGYNIVPNSLSKLIENIEKIGFKVLKQSEYEQLLHSLNQINQANHNYSSPQIENEPLPMKSITSLQLLGGMKIIPPQQETPLLNTKEDKKQLIDPFGDTTIQLNTNTVESKPDKEKEPIVSKEEVIQPKEPPTFQHQSPPLIEPNDPFEKLWFHIKQKAKEDSIAFYSLIVNAQPLEIRNGNTLVIGFTNKHTYQMNQFKRDDNQEKFKNILKELTSQDFSIECEIITDKNIKSPSKPQTHEYQILGGKPEGSE